MAEMKFSTSSSDTKEFNGKKAGKIAVIAVIAVALIIVLFNCFSIVNERRTILRPALTSAYPL